jgi:hypothetical protein
MSLHPIFQSILRAHSFDCGPALSEDDAPVSTPKPVRSPDGDEERCRGCSVTREQHRHMEAPCPFEDCPFKEGE